MAAITHPTDASLGHPLFPPKADKEGRNISLKNPLYPPSAEREGRPDSYRDGVSPRGQVIVIPFPSCSVSRACETNETRETLFLLNLLKIK